MKAKWVVVLSLFLGVMSVLVTSNAWSHCKKKLVPEAICSTIATNAPLPTYVCCKLYDKSSKSYVFRNQWVSGSCEKADTRAVYDRGCTPSSLVYGTNSTIPPIAGFCQFSYSATKHYHETLF